MEMSNFVVFQVARDKAVVNVPSPADSGSEAGLRLLRLGRGGRSRLDG
jgi:hypothetical protein